MGDLNSLHLTYLQMVPDIVGLELLLFKRDKSALKILVPIANPKDISSFAWIVIQQNL